MEVTGRSQSERYLLNMLPSSSFGLDKFPVLLECHHLGLPTCLTPLGRYLKPCFNRWPSLVLSTYPLSISHYPPQFSKASNKCLKFQPWFSHLISRILSFSVLSFTFEKNLILFCSLLLCSLFTRVSACVSLTNFYVAI